MSHPLYKVKKRKLTGNYGAAAKARITQSLKTAEEWNLLLKHLKEWFEGGKKDLHLNVNITVVLKATTTSASTTTAARRAVSRSATSQQVSQLLEESSKDTEGSIKAQLVRR